MKVEYRFQDMRKGPMTNIMQQRRNTYRKILIIGDFVCPPQFVQDPRSNMHDAKRMCKSGMFGALVGKVGQTKLTDTSQTLEFGSVDQSRKERTVGFIRFEADDIVD
jgi:hypothetical protein